MQNGLMLAGAIAGTMGGREGCGGVPHSRRRRYTAGWLPQDLVLEDSEGLDAEPQSQRCKRARVIVEADPAGNSNDDDATLSASVLSNAFNEMMLRETPEGLDARIYLQAPDCMLASWVERQAEVKGFSKENLSPTIDCAAVISAACWQRLLAYRNLLKDSGLGVGPSLCSLGDKC